MYNFIGRHSYVTRVILLNSALSYSNLALLLFVFQGPKGIRGYPGFPVSNTSFGSFLVIYASIGFMRRFQI